MFGPPQPVPRTGHRSAVPSERAAHRSVRLPGSRPNGGPADGPSGQGKPPALVGQTPTRSPHSERKSRLSLLNSKFQVTRRFDATSVSEDPPPVSLGIRRSFRSGSNQNERTLQLKSLRRNFNLWLSLVPSSHQRPPAPPLGSSTVTSVPRVAAVTSDSDGGRGAMSPPAGDGRLSLSSVSSMSLDLSPTGTPTGIEAGPAAVHEDLLSASSSVSWLHLQRAEREANTVVLKRAVSGWRGKFQRRCIGLLIADDQHGRRLVYLGLVALAKTVGLRRNARELLWRAFRLRALTALRLMATMLREKGVVRSSNRARAAVGDGAFIAYLKARGLCALRRFPQRFREAGANAKVVEFNCARFGELWNRSVVSHHPQIRIAMKLLYKQVFSSRDERARWTLADSGRRRIPAVALLKRWMHKARRVDDGTYVPSTPNPKHESIIQVSTDMAAPASLNRGGVLIRVMSRLLARWANAAVSAVRFRTAYERADFAFSLKLTIKSWDLLKMTVAARKYYWHVSEVQSLINYRRNLFMRFSRRIAVAQSLFTRSDRRIRRAAKYHRRRCLLRCLRLWHRRKRQADRALLATAALSRSSVRLLRESKKQEYRERSLAAKYRKIRRNQLLQVFSMWLRLSDALLLYRVGLMRRGIQRLREMVVMHYTQRGLCHVGGSHFMVHRAKSFLSALSRRVVVHKAAATDYPILDCVANSVRSGVNEATVSSAVPVAVLSQRPPPPPLPPPPNRQLSVDGRPVSNDSQHPPPPPPPPSRHFAVSDGVVMKEVCWRPPPPLTRHFAVPDGTMSIAERARFFEQLPLMQTESLSPNRKVKCDEIANKCYNRDESVGAVDCHEISPSTAKPRRASVLAQLFGSVDTENFDRPANTDCIVENEDPTSAQYHGALGLSDIHTLDKTELSEGSAAAASKPFRRASLLRRRRSSVSFYSKDLFSFDDGKSPNYSELGNDSFCSFEAIPEDVMKTQDEGHLVDKKLAPIKHEADFGYRFL